MTLRRILMTGASGFVGRALSLALLDGGFDVFALARGACDVHPQVDTIRIDGRGSMGVAEATRRAFERARPDVVISLATQRESTTLEDVASMFDCNVQLPALLAAALAERGSGSLIATCSYVADPQRPRCSLYASSRAAASATFEWLDNHSRCRVATLAPSSIYGPNDTRPKLLPALLSAARTGTPIRLSDPRHALDLIHVDDVVRAYMRTIELLDGGEIDSGTRWDVATGISTPLREIVELMEKATSSTIDARWGEHARPLPIVAPASSSPSLLPGYEPQTMLARGLASLATLP